MTENGLDDIKARLVLQMEEDGYIYNDWDYRTLRGFREVLENKDLLGHTWRQDETRQEY